MLYNELLSQRLRRGVESLKTDDYEYDEFPTLFRNQVTDILLRAIGPWKELVFGGILPEEHPENIFWAETWRLIHLESATGVEEASSVAQPDPCRACLALLQDPRGHRDTVLDIIDLSFSRISDWQLNHPGRTADAMYRGGVLPHPSEMGERGAWQALLPANEAIRELNQRFDQQRLGYEFRDGMLHLRGRPDPYIRISLELSQAAPQSLSMAGYNFILDIMWNMARVFEQRPRTYEAFDEQDFRDNFLAHLNGPFYGCATAETFSHRGHTDIYIAKDGHCLFVAECKFWRGEKSIRDAVTQLLGYSTWRDARLCLVVLNRNLNFSNVIRGVHAAIQSHGAFVQNVDYDLTRQGATRYWVGYPGDASRHLMLTALCFDVPAPG
jgi:hypothetical protein